MTPNGPFILSLKGLDRQSRGRSMGIENFHAQALPRPCTLLGLERLWGEGRLMDCSSELPGPPRCPYPCVSACAFAATPQNPGSFRVFQGLPGSSRGPAREPLSGLVLLGKRSCRGAPLPSVK